MEDESTALDQVLDRLRETLEASLDIHRDRFPDLTVEEGDPEAHQAFIPLIAELLSREEARGTKGMSGMDQSLDERMAQVAHELEHGRAVILRDGDELIGYATLGVWEVPEGGVVEFCSAVVDDPFRGMGFGRTLVDAREIVALEQLVPDGYQPLAFCNKNSARIYNREIWREMPWEWYRRYPVPVVCRAECQVDPSACDCTVLGMDLDALAEVCGVDPEGLHEELDPDDGVEAEGLSGELEEDEEVDGEGQDEEGDGED